MTVWYRAQNLVIVYEFGSCKNVLLPYQQILGPSQVAVAQLEKLQRMAAFSNPKSP